MSDIDKYIVRAVDMRKFDEQRDLLFAGIDDMWHGRWELPAELGDKPDLRTITDLSPHDALKSGTAILSTSMPHWTVQPLEQNQKEQERAEKIAYALDYNYRRMNNRGNTTVLWDLVHSCLRYDAVAVWLDYLPYQFKAFKTPTLRQKHALRGGDFVCTVYNPRNVHVQKDAYGTNCVLLTINMTAQEVVNKWGYRANKLTAKLKKDEDTGTTRFIYNDMMLYEDDVIKRIAWGNIVSDDNIDKEGTDEFVFMNDKIDTPFMPWIVRVGGSGLDTESEYSVHPLLAPLYHTGKWKDLCVFQSILQSEIIKYGRTPRVKTITPSGDGVNIDYQDGTTLNLKVGEEADAWRPSPIDPNLKELVDRVRAEVSSATLPRILQNPEFAGNTPFASINAMIQTALGGLNPAKALCQSAHEEIALRMIEWCNKEEKPLLAYRFNKSAKEGMDIGSAIVLTPEMLNPDYLMISCKLFAEAPTDFAQRLQAAISMNQYLKVPRSDVLEGLGKDNVDSLYDQWVQEQQDDTTVQLDIEAQKAKLQLQVQAETMKMQMAAQQAQMQQQQEAQQGAAAPTEGGGYPSNAQGMGGTGVPEGQGINPNPGMNQQPGANPGASPMAGNPGVGLREQISGQDVTGMPIA